MNVFTLDDLLDVAAQTLNTDRRSVRRIVDLSSAHLVLQSVIATRRGRPRHHSLLAQSVALIEAMALRSPSRLRNAEVTLAVAAEFVRRGGGNLDLASRGDALATVRAYADGEMRRQQLHDWVAARLIVPPDKAPEPAATREVTKSLHGVGLFAAHAVTRVDGELRRELPWLREAVRDVAHARHVHVFEPGLDTLARHRAPNDEPPLPNEMVRRNQEQFAASDALVVFGEAVSLGVGIEAGWARPARMPIILVQHDGSESNSTFVHGLGVDVYVVEYGDPSAMRNEFAEVIDKIADRLLAHRTLRQDAEVLYSDELTALTQRWGKLAATSRSAIADELQLTVERIEQLLSGPLIYAQSGQDEARMLRERLRLPEPRQEREAPRLSDPEMEALATASELRGMTGVQVIQLQREALVAKCAPGFARFDLRDPDHWIDLAMSRHVL